MNFNHPTCPDCGHKINAHLNLEDEAAKPRPGDISICVYCGSAHFFGEDLSLEKLDPEAIKETHPVEYLQIVRSQHVIKNRIKMN